MLCAGFSSYFFDYYHNVDLFYLSLSSFDECQMNFPDVKNIIFFIAKPKNKATSIQNKLSVWHTYAGIFRLDLFLFCSWTRYIEIRLGRKKILILLFHKKAESNNKDIFVHTLVIHSLQSILFNQPFIKIDFEWMRFLFVEKSLLWARKMCVWPNYSQYQSVIDWIFFVVKLRECGKSVPHSFFSLFVFMKTRNQNILICALDHFVYIFCVLCVVILDQNGMRMMIINKKNVDEILLLNHCWCHGWFSAKNGL